MKDTAAKTPLSENEIKRRIERLYRRYYERFMKALIPRLDQNPSQSAQDIIQNFFEKKIRTLIEAHPEKDPDEGLIFTALINCRNDWLRKFYRNRDAQRAHEEHSLTLGRHTHDPFGDRYNDIRELTLSRAEMHLPRVRGQMRCALNAILESPDGLASNFQELAAQAGVSPKTLYRAAAILREAARLAISEVLEEQGISS